MTNEIFSKLLIRITISCIVIMVLSMMRCCRMKNEASFSEKGSNTITRIIHDTAWYQLKEKQTPKPTDSLPGIVPVLIDTAAILESYYKRYAYRDTLSDSSIVIAIADTVSENRITSRQFSYRIKRPEIIQEIRKENPRRNFLYAGAALSVNRNLISGFSSEVLLIAKNNNAYGVGYDLLNKSISARMYWKINLRHE